MMNLEPNQCRGGCSPDVDRGLEVISWFSVGPLTGMVQALLWDLSILRTAFSLLLVVIIREVSRTAVRSLQ